MNGVPRRLTRSQLVATAAALIAAPRALATGTAGAPHAFDISVRNVGGGYPGDRSRFATVSPGVKGRNTALISFMLTGDAEVTIDVLRTDVRGARAVETIRRKLPAGAREVAWTPKRATPIGSYVLRLTVEGNGRRRVYGGPRPRVPSLSRAPAVRLLGVEARFERTSYDPEEPMRLHLFTDAKQLIVTFLRVGYGPDPSLRGDTMTGEPVGKPVVLEWGRKRGAPSRVDLQAGFDWPSGMYVAKVSTYDGRFGFAPFVIRPRTPAAVRVGVVMPTLTWQAYNFYDADGDGFGDTWYAGNGPVLRLDRPYRDRGVPPRFRRYDFPFLRWLEKRSFTPDILTEEDVEALGAETLRTRYDVLWYPGHTEYVTTREYDTIRRYRDLGGRLVFLSANNFFWRVDRGPGTIKRVKLWRDAGAPESALLGVQYRGNDDGQKQGLYYVVGRDAAPWLFEGTGLVDGATFGQSVGGFGIEVDGTTKDSPEGTVVVALVPSLLGPGRHGEMSYYETDSGSRVFSAGTLDFGSSVLNQPMFRMMENLWFHMVEPSGAAEPS